jgi:phosphoribosyl-AMP cyclohydrolase
MDEAVLQGVKFDANGLVCAVAQDWQSGRVLMVAWMNAEALAQTAATGYAHYYSRSRRKQWMKGEESGHTQKVHELRLDCDGDAVVMRIEQNGGIACHTGRQSCFYKVWRDGRWQIADAVLKDEAEIYGKTHGQAR